MTDQDAADCDKRVVNVGVSFVSNTQAAELMQPTDRPFHDPSVHAQTGAVVGVASSDLRICADLHQAFAIVESSRQGRARMALPLENRALSIAPEAY